MTAFDRAIAAMFDNPDLVRTITYTPPGEEPVPVEIDDAVPQMMDTDAILGRSNARRDVMVFEIPVVSLAAPAREGVITYLGDDWTINSTPTHADDERLTWRIEAFR